MLAEKGIGHEETQALGQHYDNRIANVVPCFV